LPPRAWSKPATPSPLDAGNITAGHPQSKEPSLSFLTKLFVILLVFFSLLMTAATIVYVGKQDTRLATLEQTELRLRSAEGAAKSANTAAQAAEA
jgi:hypothetical protein